MKQKECNQRLEVLRDSQLSEASQVTCIANTSWDPRLVLLLLLFPLFTYR